jgi:hypothetical protein
MGDSGSCEEVTTGRKSAGAWLVRVWRHRVRGVPRQGRHRRLHRCEQGVLLPGRRAGPLPVVQRARRLCRNGEYHRLAALCQAGGGSAVCPLGDAAGAVEPAADLHPAPGADQCQRTDDGVRRGGGPDVCRVQDRRPSARRLVAIRSLCAYSPSSGRDRRLSATLASMPRPPRSSCGQARLQTRGPTISSSSTARPSSSRASRNEGIPAGSCGR